MNCFTHNGRTAVGVCALCGKAVCRECVSRDAPRLVCAACTAGGVMPGYGWYGSYGYGYEYKSSIAIGAWPLIHVCAGIDPATLRPGCARLRAAMAHEPSPELPITARVEQNPRNQ